MRLSHTLAALAALLPASLAAQDAIVTARAAYQTVNYSLKVDGVQKDVSQDVVPFALVVPVGGRFTVDLATAYARSSVRATGSTSTVAGLTDTQLRGSYTFGADAVVVTAGLNLPTGQSTATDRQFMAAENISNDFLLFPIGTMGAGLSTTGGIAVTRPLGDWNLGLGASFRHSADFSPYEFADGRKAHYQPGDEWRARAGVDRSFGASRATLGATYSSFGDDRSGGAVFNTGNRAVVQASYETTVRAVGYALDVWDLTRTKGRRASGMAAPNENIFNAALGASFTLGGVALRPSIETRQLLRKAALAEATFGPQDEGHGRMQTFGLASRWTRGAVQVSPAASYSIGALDDADLTGWRASVAVRFTP